MPSTIDASIPLGYKPANGLSSLSDMLGVANRAVSLQAAQGNLSDQTNLRDVANNAPLSADGSVDQNALQQAALKRGGLLGPGYATAAAGADQQNVAATKAHFQLTGEQQQTAQNALTAVANDPRITSGDPEQATQALYEARDLAISKGVPRAVAEMSTAPLIATAAHDPKSLPQMLKNQIQASMGSAGQQGTFAPNLSLVPTKGGIQPFNMNANAPGGAGPVGGAMTPPNQLASDSAGNPAIVNPTDHSATGFNAPAPGAPVMALPPGETPQTRDELQAQRTAAQTAIIQAPAQHDLNRTIRDLATSGTITGKGGEWYKEIASRLGYQVGGDQASDINLLGKALERSALTTAQTMGPHTNAGLESVRAGSGTTGYDPKTIAKIADLNDSLLTGSQAYQQGLEKAVATSPNGVFAKRQFDQDWANNYDPRITSYLNAKQRGDTAAMADIKKEVGAGQKAIDFATRMQALDKLTNGGGL